MPEPSPITKPERFLSKGQQALAGSPEARVCKIVKPLMPKPVIVASVPPDTHTSSLPERTRSKAFPRASVPEAQAVAKVQEGPFMPNCILMFPAASFGIRRGTVIGGIRSGAT